MTLRFAFVMQLDMGLLSLMVLFWFLSSVMLKMFQAPNENKMSSSRAVRGVCKTLTKWCRSRSLMRRVR